MPRMTKSRKTETKKAQAIRFKLKHKIASFPEKIGTSTRNDSPSHSLIKKKSIIFSSIIFFLLSYLHFPKKALLLQTFWRRRVSFRYQLFTQTLLLFLIALRNSKNTTYKFSNQHGCIRQNTRRFFIEL